MRVFRPIVEATTNLVAIDVADLAHRSGIRAKPVGDDVPRAAIFLHDALQKVQRRSLVPLRGDHRFQNLAFVIGSPPEIAELPLIFTKTSSKCQRHWGKRRMFATRLFRISAANIGPNRFHQNRTVSWLMFDPALGQRILDVAQRQRVPHVHHYDQTNHLWRAVEISKWAARGPKLPRPENLARVRVERRPPSARFHPLWSGQAAFRRSPWGALVVKHFVRRSRSSAAKFSGSSVGPAVTAKPRWTAGRALSSSNQRLKYLNSSMSCPCAFQFTVQR